MNENAVKRKRGRPRNPQERQWAHQVTGYVNEEQRELYLKLGGSRWLRGQLDKLKEGSTIMAEFDKLVERYLESSIRFTSKTGQKIFLNAVRKVFEPVEVVDLRPNQVVATRDGVWMFSGLSGMFYGPDDRIIRVPAK